MKKRLLQMFFLCLPLAVLLTASASAADSAVNDVFTVTDLANLNGKNGTYYLRNDLDLSAYGDWTPIATFSGTFDGQGHTIKGVKVAYNGSAGLFSRLSGIVRNLNLEVDITSTSTGSGHAGGLTGQLDYCGQIDRVSVSGSVRGLYHVGGLVGFCDGASISNSCSSASVSVAPFTAGGGKVAGLVGNCGIHYTQSSPSATRFSHTPTIRNCYASGAVTPLPASDTNQSKYTFQGLANGSANVTNSYYCNYNSSGASGLGMYLNESEMKVMSTYTDWDFDTVWRMSASQNGGLPYLRAPANVIPTGVNLNMSTMTLESGDSKMLQATILPVNATARQLEWHSSDESVVTLSPVSHNSSGEINARMTVNAKARGVAVVTAVTKEGKLEAACTVTVSDGQSEPLPVYRLNGITLKSTNGNPLTVIPSGTFLATVSVTNIASTESPTVMLAAYTSGGKFTGLFYVTLKSPVGGTIEATLPVDNSAGNIAQLKAFAVKSFSGLEPIGEPVSFPAQ